MSTVANMKNKTETREGYKKTELGWLPKEWAEINLGSLCQVTAGGTPSTTKAEYWGGHIPWMNSGEINLKQIYDVAGRITKLGLDNSSTKLLPKNCVLIALAGQGSTRGKVAINRIELCTNQSIAAYIVSSNNLDFEFLYHNLASRYNELRLISSGNETRGGLNLTILRSVKIYLPPLPEQEKIAEILSCWDQAIETMEKLLAAKIRLKKTLTKKLLVPKPHWVEKMLGDVLDYEQPTKYQVKEVEDFLKDKIPVLTANKSYIIGSTSDKEGIYKKGSCIIFDDFTTDTKYVDFEFKIKSSAIKILTAKPGYNIKFIFELMQNINHPIGGHKRHYLSEFQYMTLILPELEVQDKIATIVSCFNHNINLYGQNLELIKNQKKGLLQKLMNGSIRVKFKE